tara:strand:- start:477 stop:1313 length:837 start_codon:yes stop_codon:yes gene_type:complete
MTKNHTLIWDETFPSLLLEGEGASAFLHGQTTEDVFARKYPGRTFFSCWLSTKGSLKALLEIRLSNNMAQVVVISGDIKSVKHGFESVIFPADKVKLEVLSPIRRIQEINNDNSWRDLHSHWIDNENVIIKGISNYKKATKQELEIWKIRQGIPVFGREINGETNPYELGLGDLIKLDKGCYLGQEAMARFFRSKSFKYQLRYWKASGKSNDFEIGKNFLNTNQDQILKKKVGFITSKIRVNDDLFKGLALIKTSFIDNDCFSENGFSITIKRPISFV